MGLDQRFVYTYPSRAALMAVTAKVRALTRKSTNQSLSTLLHRLNPVLRGWANYHRHGASAKTFSYLPPSHGGGFGAGCAISTPRRRWGIATAPLRKWWPVQDG